MNLFAVRVFIDDLAAARSFYADVLGLTELWSDDGAAGYDVGAATLIVELATEGHESLRGRFTGVSLQVDDIDAAHRDLSARGVPFWGPPQRQPWGGCLVHFRDPAGNTLSLVAA